MLYKQSEGKHGFGPARSVPLVVGYSTDIKVTILVSMLADYLGDDRQAAALAPSIARLLPNKMAAETWVIPEDHLEYLVTLALVKARERHGASASIEYLCGQRRDIVRRLMSE